MSKMSKEADRTISLSEQKHLELKALKDAQVPSPFEEY
jgi:hypothetical protein